MCPAEIDQEQDQSQAIIIPKTIKYASGAQAAAFEFETEENWDSILNYPLRKTKRSGVWSLYWAWNLWLRPRG